MDHQNTKNEIARASLFGNDVSAPKGYQERLDLKLCTRCGKEPCKADSNLGEHCHPKVKVLQARSARKRRAAAKRKKLCTRCVKRRRSPLSDWGCARCLSDLNRLKFPAVDQHVDQRGDRTRDHLERDGYERTRFHGQAKRGAPSTESLDTMDLRQALKDLVEAAHGHQYAQSDEVQQKPIIQRDSHVDDWVVVVSRVRRVLGGIEERHPATMQRMHIDDNRRRGVEIAKRRGKTRR